MRWTVFVSGSYSYRRQTRPSHLVVSPQGKELRFRSITLKRSNTANRPSLTLPLSSIHLSSPGPVSQFLHENNKKHRPTLTSPRPPITVTIPHSTGQIPDPHSNLAQILPLHGPSLLLHGGGGSVATNHKKKPQANRQATSTSSSPPACRWRLH